MNKYLFLFTIPSVQEFISQARKTHDLWAGSQIYSVLVKYAAVDLFEKKYKGELIFPVSNAKQFTNLFLGEIETDNPQDIGENIESRIKEKFFEMAEETVKKAIDINNLPKGFEEQINSVLDIKWAFVEYRDNYKEAYEEIVKVVGAIKNIRNFEQFHYQELDGKIIYGEKGRKCSVDGIRNVKFYRLSDSEQDNDRLYDKKLFIDNKKEVVIFHKSFWDTTNNSTKNEKAINPRYLQAGEGLSAVSFFKRCYKDKTQNIIDFPSTAEISVLSFLHNILKSGTEGFNILYQIRSKFHLENDNDYLINALRMGNSIYKKSTEFNYQWFYKEDLKKYENQNVNKDGLIIEDYNFISQKITDLYKKFGKPLKYYAIVVFDGDSMGKQLSKVKSIEEHRKISKALSKFSNKVKEIDFTYDISKLSRVVYSGGDDVLAFVNLEYMFDFLNEVRNLYSKNMQPVADELNKNRENDKFRFTISAGVAIAHYKTPLNIVINKAREMEKLAKENEGKNSFAIAVLRRSGEINQGVWKWKKNEKFIFEPFKKLLKELKSDNISGTFIKNIQEEFEHLMDKQGNIIVKPEILIKEFDRLFARAKNKNMKDNDFINLRKEVDLLLPERSEKEFNLKNFFNTLNIIDFLYRKTY